MNIGTLTAALFLVVGGCKSTAAPNDDAPVTTAQLSLTSTTKGARDYISIVGSSTVYPFSTVVAEQFGKATQFKTPKVESTGSGGGIKLFCDGVGAQHPDIANSSRRIKSSEIEQCAKNGVKDVVEMKIGYDGIVLANSKRSPLLNLSLRDLWLALAREVPDPNHEGETLVNPHRLWSDVNAQLPASRIEVLGPPPTSGTRDAFVELAMESGCATFEWIERLKSTDAGRYKVLCHTVREDGAFIEAGENDNLIVQKLEANPTAHGIFGFSFLDQNADKVQAAQIAGVSPTFETISDGRYPVARPLYFYVKKAHTTVIPGIGEYLREFTSGRAWGPDGYLADKGMIPMSDAERGEFAKVASDLAPLTH